MYFVRPRILDRTLPLPLRVYAIGDIHGRVDLFNRMIGLIRRDVAQRPAAAVQIVVLGDFIDRGPGSAALIRRFMRLRRQPDLTVLKGNHEAAMVAALDGDHDSLEVWLAHGGAATLAGFGIDTTKLDMDDTHRILAAARRAIPRSVRSWLARLPTHVQIGDYYFVHAGIRPGTALADQTDMDRLWIADEFTGSDADHGAVIVHGHTISERGVIFARNRIGVDTGAYRTHRLSAVGLEGDARWSLTAANDDADDDDRPAQLAVGQP